ncbi:hypothetical protein FACS189415_8050 [Bacteroidia bacterium]|nr:hypothetical protein FACS189415_8050 [Bacteroidia bacterium]
MKQKLKNNKPGETMVSPDTAVVEDEQAVRQSAASPVRASGNRNYSLFLESRSYSTKRQTYVDVELCEAVKRFLPVIAPDLSITGYINNVLSMHFRQYRDEINELYKNNFNDPL